MKSFTLSNGVSIPAMGFGTWKADETDGRAVVAQAIANGYRHIDTASAYGTEEAVGRAVAECGLPREEIFLTSKAWKTELGYDNVLRAFDASCQKLGVDYLDLYLIHWPLPEPGFSGWEQLDRDSWRALERLYEEKRVRAIGVSNFLTHHLDNILAGCNIAPMVNQIEFHPGYPQWDTVTYCREHGLLVEAWSPLGRRRLANHPQLKQMAQRYGVSVAQVCLAFALGCGVLPLPKSANDQRQRDNLAALELDLAPGDVDTLLHLPQAGWSGLHPDYPPQPAQED